MGYNRLMRYNWQQPDWPEFRYDLGALQPQLEVYREKVAHMGGLIRGMPDTSRTEALLNVMVAEAIKTSEIEGEYLSRADVMSSIRNNLGLNAPREKVHDRNALGISELMVDARQGFASPLSAAMVFKWHEMLFSPFRKRMTVGGWRSHDEPMQVVSGPIGKQKVHFEAPPSGRVAVEMTRFIDWFNLSAPGGGRAIKDAPVRAALAHIYFETIHPFEDGNGRIGRAISEKALSQGAGRPIMLSLSKTIEARKKKYYEALENAQKSNDVTNWIHYFVGEIMAAQDDAERLIDFILQKTRFYDRFREELNKNQTLALARIFEEGPNGFQGGMTAKKYMAITGVSKATATRDLARLAEIGALRSVGSGRAVRYELLYP